MVVVRASPAVVAADVAAEVSGEDRVNRDSEREMGAEDFSYMLQARPGAYLFLGQGPGAGLHHPAYDFNDEIAPVGASFLMPSSIIGPSPMPKPPMRPKTMGTRISATMAESRLVMISVMKTRIVV